MPEITGPWKITRTNYGWELYKVGEGSDLWDASNPTAIENVPNMLKDVLGPLAAIATAVTVDGEDNTKLRDSYVLIQGEGFKAITMGHARKAQEILGAIKE